MIGGQHVFPAEDSLTSPPSPSSFLDTKFDEHLRYTRKMWAFGAMGALALWIWDLVLDPVGARATLGLRVFMAVLCLAPMLSSTRSARARLVSKCVIIGAVFGTASVFFFITSRLSGGMLYGIGGFAFFQLAGFLALPGLSMRAIAFSHLGLTAVPHGLALLWPEYGFQHVPYGVLLWPCAVMAVAAQSARASEYARAYALQQELHALSTIDPLTGVPNRRSFHEVSAHSLATVRRHGRPLSLLIVDADHFKRLNDQHGHLAGDTVLREMAQAIGRSLRKSDVLCRWGGEEFVILLPEADQADAAVSAERVIAAVRALRLAGPAAAVGKVSVSVGVATLTSADNSVDELIARADAALYEAKRLGRGRAEVAPAPLVASTR